MTSADTSPLHRLTYVSTVASTVLESDISDLVAQAQAKNEMLNVTGLLLFNGLNFLQTLEGPREQVLQLFNRITADNRHDGVVCVQSDKPATRAFANWSMAYAPVARAGTNGDAFASNGFNWSNGRDVLPDQLKSLYLAFNSLARGFPEA